MDYDIARAKELIDQREEIDRQLAAIFGSSPGKSRAVQRCSKCGKEGHTARTCADKEAGTPPASQ